MKNLFTLILSFLLSTTLMAQNNVGVNTTNPDASAALDVTSITQGMLVPRMDKDHREAISSPATGLLVWQTDGVSGFYFNSGTPVTPAWIQLGAKGDKGDMGTVGPKGDAGNPGDPGMNGINGQGVPTGGISGQVLSKVDGADYSTQWITPGASGTPLPAQTGNGGKFLKTDGTNASWATVSTTYPNVEFQIINSASQSITSLFGSATNNEYSISGSNSSNALSTGGNSWNGSVFTIGTNGAGWYDIYVQVKGVSSVGAASAVGASILLDKNNTIGANSISGSQWTSTYNSATVATDNKNVSTLRALMYLSAGENIRFRGQSWSNSQPAYTSTDGSTSLTIVRIK